MKQLYTLHKRASKFLMPGPNMDYNQKCCALKLLPLDIHNYYSTNVFYAKYFSRQSPTVQCVVRKKFITDSIFSVMSFTYMTNYNGPDTNPCGTPFCFVL